MLRQHHHRARANQPLHTSLLQIGRELAVQALKVLVVTWVEQGFDAQQVAVFTRHAMVERQLDAQVGKVMAFRALLGPEAVAAQGGDEDQRQCASKQFSHGTVSIQLKL
ncbi:hypothetical protein D3C81_1163050 [compost metagenome]